MLAAVAGCWRRLPDHGQNQGAAEGVVGAGFVIIMVSCGVWGRGVVEVRFRDCGQVRGPQAAKLWICEFREVS